MALEVILAGALEELRESLMTAFRSVQQVHQEELIYKWKRLESRRPQLWSTTKAIDLHLGQVQSSGVPQMWYNFRAIKSSPLLSINWALINHPPSASKTRSLQRQLYLLKWGLMGIIILLHLSLGALLHRYIRVLCNSRRGHRFSNKTSRVGLLLSNREVIIRMLRQPKCRTQLIRLTEESII
jgi:hypothetical protein